VAVLGDVDGMEIFGGTFFGSSSTCLVVRISLGGIGCVGNCNCVGNCTIDSDGDDGDMDTLGTCGVKVDAGKGCLMVLTTAAADVDNTWVACPECPACPGAGSCCGLNIVTPGGMCGVS